MSAPATHTLLLCMRPLACNTRNTCGALICNSAATPHPYPPLVPALRYYVFYCTRVRILLSSYYFPHTTEDTFVCMLCKMCPLLQQLQHKCVLSCNSCNTNVSSPATAATQMCPLLQQLQHRIRIKSFAHSPRDVAASSDATVCVLILLPCNSCNTASVSRALHTAREM
jgi:hypothetical protein